MKKIKYFILFFLLMLTVLQSKTYEDGEDKTTKRWHVLSSFSSGVVSNVYDKNKSSYVITFKGEGTKSAYMLKGKDGGSWNNEKEHILHWQMKYSEDFVILVGIETDKGKRYLIYTPGIKNGYMQYGLGSKSINGTWQRYTRNLEKDLERFDNHNHIRSVETFVIRGNGSMDNVKMMKNHFTKEELLEKEKIRANKKLSKNKESSKKKQAIQKYKPIKTKKPIKIKKVLKLPKTDNTPIIYIKGENPFFLKKGEKFIEPGVTAKDEEDGELSVICNANIDNQKEGRYSVIYMATDSQGNSAVDTRYIKIGEGKVSEEDPEEPTEKKRFNDFDDEKKEILEEEEEDADFKLEERELEISEWEKELELREKEISQREQQLQTSM